MRCTSCSQRITPVVAIDIDGTLGDYHGHFHAFAAEYLDDWTWLHQPGFGGVEDHKDWFCRTFGVDLHVFRDIKLAYRQGAQKRSMMAFVGAADLTDSLCRAGAEVWLTTTRPYQRLDNVDPDTRAWLERHRIRYDHVIYDDQKYSVLAGQVDPKRVVGVLDDLAEQYALAASVFGPATPILRRTAYNHAVKPVNAVDDLVEAREVLLRRIHQWEARHT